MTETCPLLGCYKEEETMEELNDHVSQDHDVFTAIVKGDATVIPTELFEHFVNASSSVNEKRETIRADGGEAEQ